MISALGVSVSDENEVLTYRPNEIIANVDDFQGLGVCPHNRVKREKLHLGVHTVEKLCEEVLIHNILWASSHRVSTWILPLV